MSILLVFISISYLMFVANYYFIKTSVTHCYLGTYQSVSVIK